MQMICILTMLCSHWYIHIWLTLFGKHINTIGEIHLAYITRIIVYDLYVCPYQVLMYEYIYFSQKVQQMYTFF